MAQRFCRICGAPIPLDASPVRVYCSQHCAGEAHRIKSREWMRQKLARLRQSRPPKRGRVRTRGLGIPRSPLAVRRVELGLSQAMLGEMTGVTGAMISDYECRRRDPRVSTAYKLARALNCTIEDLFPPDAYVDHGK